MTYSIVFKRYDPDPVADKIRDAARREGWAGGAGLKAWAKQTFNATLHTGKYGDITSIRFRSQADLDCFKQQLAVK